MAQGMYEDDDPAAAYAAQYPEIVPQTAPDPMAADEAKARQWMESWIKTHDAGGVSQGPPDYDKAMALYRQARANGQDHQAALTTLTQYGGTSDPNFWMWPAQATPGAPAPPAPTGSASGTRGYTGRVNGILDNVPESFYEAPDAFSYPDFVPPEYNTPEFQAPDRFSYPEFALPSGQDVLNEDPGYDIRKREGMRTITNKKAAEGVLRSPATYKGMVDWVEGLASQEYGQAVGRKFNTWQANRGAAADDYDRQWKNLLTTYALADDRETNEYNRAKSTYGTNFGTAATTKGFDLDIAAGKAGGKQGATSLAGNLALGAGSLNLNADNSRWNNLISLYDISTRNLPTYQPTAGSYGYAGG